MREPIPGKKLQFAAARAYEEWMKTRGWWAIAGALIVANAAPARAQIGRDVAAAERLYGSAVAVGKDKNGFVQRVYRKGGRDVIVTLVDGMIKRVVFRKQGGGAFSAEELRAIARKEGLRAPANHPIPREGSAWSSRQGQDVTRAVYDPGTNVFTITKDSFYKAKKRQTPSPKPTPSPASSRSKGGGTSRDR
ncbi:MAG TPA: hypothetical protein VGF73_08880 [Chthoniobacterales bacterium]